MTSYNINEHAITGRINQVTINEKDTFMKRRKRDIQSQRFVAPPLLRKRLLGKFYVRPDITFLLYCK